MESMSGATIVWFRRDLRVTDNPALAHAAALGAPVIPIYAAHWEAEDRWKPGVAGRWWLGESLSRLAEALSAFGLSLITVPGAPDEAIPALARRVGAAEVVWNRLYEPYSRDVEARLAAALERDGVAPRSFDAGLLFEPEGHLSRAGKPFVQFTAYWRRCLSLPEPEPPLPRPEGLRAMRAGDLESIRKAGPEWVPEGQAGGDPGWTPARADGQPVWQPGEAGAWRRAEQFVDCCLSGYGSSRDIPGVDGTSRLSPHLHFGEIGPRQVWHAVRAAEAELRVRGGPAARAEGAGESAAPFLRQLGWREFAHYILFHFPSIPDQPFRPEFGRFPWQEDPKGLEDWKWGATGYPLVDAAARQLLAEGWVHNRARLVSASFLTKDLLIPWQQGAAWYWDRLVDADLANNTLGWQWTAGSGPDAAPFFRVFNPVLQARRFDPEGAYIAKWAPEDPPVPPVVDHSEARARALAAFRGMLRA